MKKKYNVCYLHKQDSNTWQWFIADEYGRAMIKCTEQFNTHEEATKDYEHHGSELEEKLVYKEPEGVTTVNGIPIK